MVSPALPLVLGSASPARLETLRRAGVAPYVLVSDVDEDAVVAQARSQYGEAEPRTRGRAGETMAGRVPGYPSRSSR